LSTSLKKGLVRIVVAGVALAALMALAILVELPSMAEAQEEEVEAPDTGAASTEAEQNITTTTTTTDEKGAPAAGVWQPAPAPSTTRLLVVEPGNSLWSISEEHIGPGATPEQISYEVERTFELNRERIGEDPNLIFPGQELVLVPPMVPPAPDSAAAAEQASKPIVAESEGVSEEALPENGVSEGAISEEAAPAPPTRDQTDEQAESAPAASAPAESAPATTADGGIAGSLLEAYDNFKVERRLLGIGILALTLIVAILMAWRMPMRRNVEDPAAWGIPQEYYYENYASPKAPPEASPKSAQRPQGEPSSPTSGTPLEDPTREPSTSSSGSTTSNPTRETEGAMPPEESTASAASARGQERLRRGRHLRRIYQDPSPRRTR
jgi:hypothetical protein